MKINSRAAWIVALCLSWGLSWGQTLPPHPLLDDVTLHVSFGCATEDPDGTGPLEPKVSTYEIWLYNDGTPDTELKKGWGVAQSFAASMYREYLVERLQRLS
jgi:hypothetical protein